MNNSRSRKKIDPYINKIVGKCLIQKCLGMGGMGTVYKAQHTSQRKYVAIKILHEHLACNESYIKRFFREATSASKLNSYHIIKVVETGWDSKVGVYYIQMELIKGVTLSNKLSKDRGIKVRTALGLLKQICDGLEVAHKKGIYHRDIKPENIIIDDKGIIKIADFGLAKLLEADVTRLTQTGQLLGTPQYMAPEQFSANIVNAQTDIYSVGVTFYQMLTGRLPFEAPTPLGCGMLKCSEDPVPSKELRKKLPQIIDDFAMKMIARNPDDRFKSIKEIEKSIEEIYKTLYNKSCNSQNFSQNDLPNKNEIVNQPTLVDHNQSSNQKIISQPTLVDQKINSETVIKSEKKIKLHLSKFFTTTKSCCQNFYKVSKSGLGKLKNKVNFLERRKTKTESSHGSGINNKKSLPNSAIKNKKKSKSRTQRIILKINEKLKRKNKSDIENFIFLREVTYRCGKNRYTVKEYKHRNSNKKLSTNMTFILIPGGTFKMGSPFLLREQPVHPVALRPFLISKNVVTQKVWKKVMGTKPWKKNNCVKKGRNFPAVYISWHEAKNFCKKTGLRLPSESQWEYCCRAGSKTRYYWGNKMNRRYCWFYNNTEALNKKYSQKIGQKRVNAFGLFDMIGNVYEWCEDVWHNNYRNAPTNGQAWVDDSSSLRITRGGSWDSKMKKCRCAHRERHVPESEVDNLGFRVVYPLEIAEV